MNFNTLSFLAFFATIYTLYLGLGSRWQAQKILLLGGSYLFYAWWNPYYIILIIASTLIDFSVVAGLRNATNHLKRRRLLLVSLFSNLGMLGVFKYFNFFAESFADILNAVGMHADPFTLDVLLPVGISFYTFQSMSYTIDVYRGKLQPDASLLDFSLFVSFFPQLVAGPIVRASDFLTQLKDQRKIDWAAIQTGGYWIVLGYIFKVGVADNLASSVDYLFNTPSQVLPAEAWLSSYYFAFQIFGDFCGYTLIARGIAKLMGFELAVNFRVPYLARNFSDFWRRWHISLSTWLRDYLYISLGGNRGTELLTYRNLMLTMLLGGLWHGANWTFIVWGAMHGGYLVGQRLFPRALPDHNTSIFRDLLSIVLVFHLVLVCWIVFRADTLGDAGQILVTMFDFATLFGEFRMPHKQLLKDGIWLLPMIVYHLAKFVEERRGKPLAIPPTLAAIGLAICLFITVVCREASDAFIYFQF